MKKFNTLTRLILMAFLFAGLLFLLFGNKTISSAGSDKISVPVPAFEPTTTTDKDGQEHITAKEYAVVGSPGDPAVPYKELQIILPPNAEPSSVSVSLEGATSAPVPGLHDIAPMPPMALMTENETTEPVFEWGENKEIVDNRNILVYGKDVLYPKSNVGLIAIGKMRKWQIARVRYYPYQYNPKSKELILYSGGNISLSFSTPMTAVDYMKNDITAYTDNVLDDMVKDFAVNYGEAKSWYELPSNLSQPNSASSEQYNYMIITTNAIVSGSTKLSDFVTHKQNRGFSVKVATETDWGGGTGDAAAENIRSYLQANYLTMGIEYVLLIGDPRVNSSSVPMKMINIYPGSVDVPSDFYFAELTGNWDANGDGDYGEVGVDWEWMIEGGASFYYDVFAGRIPFYGSFTELDSILQKTIDYESQELNKADWTKKVILSMTEIDATTLGYQLGEQIKDNILSPLGFDPIRIYDDDYGLVPPPDYYPVAINTVLGVWQAHAGFHLWLSHATGMRVFDYESVQYLDDNFPTFVFEASCSSGDPANLNNLGYALLKQGAISTISATRLLTYVWGETDYTTNTDSGGGLEYKYAYYMINNRYSSGEAHFSTMLNTRWWAMQNHLMLNIYGDPSLSGPAYDALSLQKSADKETVSSGDVVTYTLKIANPWPHTLTDLNLSDPIPAGTTYVENSASDGGVYDPDQKKVTWTLPSITPSGESGSTIEVTFKVIVN